MRNRHELQQPLTCNVGFAQEAASLSDGSANVDRGAYRKTPFGDRFVAGRHQMQYRTSSAATRLTKFETVKAKNIREQS
jgi:hypothetical protein